MKRTKRVRGINEEETRKKLSWRQKCKQLLRDIMVIAVFCLLGYVLLWLANDVFDGNLPQLTPEEGLSSADIEQSTK